MSFSPQQLLSWACVLSTAYIYKPTDFSFLSFSLYLSLFYTPRAKSYVSEKTTRKWAVKISWRFSVIKMFYNMAYFARHVLPIMLILDGMA